MTAMSTSLSIQNRHELIRQRIKQEEIVPTELTSTTCFLPGTQTLYAIPTPILSALCEMQRNGQIKKPLLSDEECQVERTWTGYCESHDIIGCCVRGNISFPLLQPVKSPPSEEFWKSLEELANSTYKQFNIDQKVDFRQYRDAFRMGTQTESEFNEQRLAFLGWLHCNSLFTSEKDQLIDVWKKDGANPAYLGGRNLLTEIDALPAQAKYSWRLNREMADQFLSFYRRWDLDGFATWDLPIQQQPNLGGPAELGERMELNGNPAIQLPSSMKFPTTLHAQHFLNQTPVDHLKEWRDILENKRTKQYAEAFVIYFYQEVVLRNVLGDRLHRCQKAIDELLAIAFKSQSPLASLHKIQAESISDLRQKFSRLRATK